MLLLQRSQLYPRTCHPSFWPFPLGQHQHGTMLVTAVLELYHTHAGTAGLGSTLLRGSSLSHPCQEPKLGPPFPVRCERWSCSGCSWLMGAGPSSIPTKFLRALHPAGWAQAPRLGFIPLQRERHKGTSQRCEAFWRNKPKFQHRWSPCFKGTECVCAWRGGGRITPAPRQLHLLGG